MNENVWKENQKLCLNLFFIFFYESKVFSTWIKLFDAILDETRAEKNDDKMKQEFYWVHLCVKTFIKFLQLLFKIFQTYLIDAVFEVAEDPGGVPV